MIAPFWIFHSVGIFSTFAMIWLNIVATQENDGETCCNSTAMDFIGFSLTFIGLFAPVVLLVSGELNDHLPADMQNSGPRVACLLQNCLIFLANILLRFT